MVPFSKIYAITRRTPQGVRGWKFISAGIGDVKTGRTPQGVRGLKLGIEIMLLGNFSSHPARGAWVEIPTGFGVKNSTSVAPRKGCVG